MLFMTGIIIFITLLNIIIYYLRVYHEEDYGERSNLGKPSWGQSYRRFSFAEIKMATHNFDEEFVLGKGGFGKVYKGIIDNGASTVAIKRLGFLSKQGAPEFWTEIQLLSKFRHGHLVSLIGYCSDQQEMIIVYEYMPGGTLDDNLHKVGTTSGNSPLSWIQRLKICIGAARGLDYLHTGTDIQTRVIHRDVKSSNILLDENLAAKISDFGLSVTGPANQTCTYVSTRVKGTFGYMDPEYFLTRRLTRKSDVYAFGVVLFEVLTGRPAVDVRLDEEHWGLALWVKHCIKEGKLDEIVDPSLRGNILPDCLKVFSETAEQCLQNSSKRRPTMAEIISRLEFALALQERTHASVADAEIISSGGDYENQENTESSTESEVTDAGNFEDNNEQNDGIMQLQGPKEGKSHSKPFKKMTFIKKVRLFFSTKPEVFTSTVFAGGEYSEVNRGFSVHELLAATDNFSSKRIVGRGGYGTVYKGRLADGSLVAVKRLEEELTDGGKLHFQRVVDKIYLTFHPNLLRLLGFCMTPTETLLVYPYMLNGSLASCLKVGRAESQSILDWPRRKQIALGSAKGLAYLHDDCSPKIIHRDVKAGNILLDENFEAVVADFRLAKLMEPYDTHVSTAVRGTVGCIAPEYACTGKCSPKTDVFGYGVMLLELVSGRRSSDLAFFANNMNSNLINWVRKLAMTKNLGPLVGLGEEMVEEMEQLIQVAVLCTHDSPTQRPKMSEVVKMLESEDGLSERWEEYLQKEEVLQQLDNNARHVTWDDNPRYISWVVDDSIGSISEEEMSPR